MEKKVLLIRISLCVEYLLCTFVVHKSASTKNTLITTINTLLIQTFRWIYLGSEKNNVRTLQVNSRVMHFQRNVKFFMVDARKATLLRPLSIVTVMHFISLLWFVIGEFV